ncbi:MAG: ATP-dependent RNA helicase DbpA [Pseudomonadota bacterium]|nr:ATP-dependent RNA helicase DbpA [Pseudomonadota bacterium]
MTTAPLTASPFDGALVPPALLQVVQELGFTAMTPIQAESLPVLFAGGDLVGQSRTGSGKTVAFGLPLLAQIDLSYRRPQALVVCPTRELSTQVALALRTLGRRLPGLRILVASGGQPGGPQRRALEEGVHLIVGTPGRLVDHLERDTIDVRAISYVVLDEADRMLDMGFQEDMERILSTLPTDRQTLFFSATFPRSIADMSARWQRHPAHVTIPDEPDAIPDIEQRAYTVEPEAKTAALVDLLRRHPDASAIVFCNFKVTAHALAADLTRAGFSTGALHGDLDQRDRDHVMARLRNRSTRVLVATDVAARGLDIEGLDLIVNYELPSQPEVYVHRIGRTGRAGKRGIALSFATPKEGSKLARIEGFTGMGIERASLEDLAATPAPEVVEAPMDTLIISGGRKDKLRAGDILGALTGEAGLLATDIGKIEIHDRFAYVAVAKPVAQEALRQLSEGRIKGRKFKVERAR